jgi:hypothetical protein
MELSPFQRFAAFAVVVLVLAGLGVYLFLPSAAGSSGSPSSPAASTPAGGATGPPASGQPTQANPAPPTGSVPDIYRWLPFTASGLASAAQVAVRFGAEYGTFSYSQNAAAYLTPLRPLITGQLGALIGRAYAAPGVAAARASNKQVSRGTAVITSLRAFGPSSLTFVETITQQITDSKGQSQQSTSYAVTLTGSGTSWQVSDIELATAGNL